MENESELSGDEYDSRVRPLKYTYCMLALLGSSNSTYSLFYIVLPYHLFPLLFNTHVHVVPCRIPTHLAGGSDWTNQYVHMKRHTNCILHRNLVILLPILVCFFFN